MELEMIAGIHNTEGEKKKTADTAMKKRYEHKNSPFAAFFVFIRKPHKNNPAK